MGVPLRLIVRQSGGTPAPQATVVTVTLPSDVSAIEEAVALVERHCMSGGPVNPRLRFRLQVALAEALANAVVYGNGERPELRVHVAAELTPDLIRITVTDEGPGFDVHAVPDPCAPDRLEATCGRGIYLIRDLVDHLSYNDRGNSLCMTLRRR